MTTYVMRVKENNPCIPYIHRGSNLRAVTDCLPCALHLRRMVYIIYNKNRLLSCHRKKMLEIPHCRLFGMVGVYIYHIYLLAHVLAQGLINIPLNMRDVRQTQGLPILPCHTYHCATALERGNFVSGAGCCQVSSRYTQRSPQLHYLQRPARLLPEKQRYAEQQLPHAR